MAAVPVIRIKQENQVSTTSGTELIIGRVYSYHSHDTSHKDALLQRRHERRKDIVVANDARLLVIARAQRLVLTVRLFVAIVVFDGAAVSRVVDKESVTRLGALGELAKGRHNVSVRWLRVLAVVQEQDNIAVFKPVDVANVLFHLCKWCVAKQG